MQEIAKAFGLKLVVLFGSYETEDFEAGVSDIDLAFLSHGVLTEAQYLSLINAFSGIFATAKLIWSTLTKLQDC